MSHSRTLVRKLKVDQDRRDKPENRRAKPGSPYRRLVRVLSKAGGRERYLHATKGVKVRLFDGSYHTVDSSEMAFKMAGSIAMKDALAQAGAVLLEPIMLLTASVPESAVGDVMGDLSSRRGRPLGTEAVGGMTEVTAEVPMAEILTYAPDLRSLTGGQGEYTMEFLRYEEVPAHLAQKVVEKAQEEEEVRA